MSEVCAAVCVWIFGNFGKIGVFRKQRRVRGQSRLWRSISQIACCRMMKRILQKTGSIDGYCGTFFKYKTYHYYKAFEWRIVSIWKISWYVWQSFSTIGLIGIVNETQIPKVAAGRYDLYMKNTGFAKNVLNHMRELTFSYQKSRGSLYNLEATPATKNPNVSSCKTWRDQFPDIITAAEKTVGALLYE